MKIISNSPQDRLYRIAAETLAGKLKELGESKDKIIFAICGGRSVAPIFATLVEISDIPWKKIHIFLVDERLVPLDNDDSNYKLAKTAFIDDLILKKSLLPQENVHPFIYKPEIEDKGISEYENELKGLSDCYDIALLSAGEDGHIGAIYPNHHSFDDESEFYIKMDDSPKPPAGRMSSSRKLLTRTKYAVLLVIGDGKRDTLRAILDETTAIKDCPAKIVKALPDATLITDLL